MNKLEYDMLMLIEEAAEIQQLASKVMRFGLHAIAPYDHIVDNNKKLLEIEIGDFLAVLERLDYIDDKRVETARLAKIEKMKIWVDPYIIDGEEK